MQQPLCPLGVSILLHYTTTWKRGDRTLHRHRQGSHRCTFRHRGGCRDHPGLSKHNGSQVSFLFPTPRLTGHTVRWINSDELWCVLPGPQLLSPVPMTRGPGWSLWPYIQCIPLSTESRQDSVFGEPAAAFFIRLKQDNLSTWTIFVNNAIWVSAHPWSGCNFFLENKSKCQEACYKAV